MFVVLFAVSVIVAFGLAFGVSLIFRRMTQNVLSRYLAENVSHATAKYLQIAILLAGVSGGARIQMLKDYVSTPAYNAEAHGALEPGDVQHRDRCATGNSLADDGFRVSCHGGGGVHPQVKDPVAPAGAAGNSWVLVQVD